MSEAWSEHHFGVHLAGGAMALVEVRAVDDPAGFGDGVGDGWRRDMLARRECAPWGEGGACVVSERDQFYALLHGALADAVAKTGRVVDRTDLDECHRAAGEVQAKVVFAPGFTHRPGGGTGARGVRAGARDAQREERRVDVLDEEVEVAAGAVAGEARPWVCLLYTSPSPRDGLLSRMPSSA